MNQNYIQVINLACIIYLIYLTLRMSRNNVPKNLKTRMEGSSIIDTIKEVLKDELKDIRGSESQSHQKINGTSENKSFNMKAEFKRFHDRLSNLANEATGSFL